MKAYLWSGLLMVVFSSTVLAQAGGKPTPEQDVLKKFVGEWSMVMTTHGQESRATSTHKLALGGLWLSSQLEGEIAGQKYSAQRLDSYDPIQKKYISIWIDSNQTRPVVTEGTYDAASQTLTQTGDGFGFDGKPAKHKWVTVMKGNDSFDLTVYFGEVKEPALTVVYKRKK
jgi:hypothetical protein